MRPRRKQTRRKDQDDELRGCMVLLVFLLTVGITTILCSLYLPR